MSSVVQNPSQIPFARAAPGLIPRATMSFALARLVGVGRSHPPSGQWMNQASNKVGALTEGGHDFSGEGAHPGHEVFNGRAEVGADVLRASLLESRDFREDGVWVADK